MFPFSQSRGGGAAAAAGVKWTNAAADWVISNGGLRATNNANSGSQSAVQAKTYGRSTGPAAFSIKIDSVVQVDQAAIDNGYGTAFGLAPTNLNVNDFDFSNIVFWYSNGDIFVGGSNVAKISGYASGDTIKFVLNSAGNSLSLALNGTVLRNQPITVIARAPTGYTRQPTPGIDITINGAPAGETAWA